MSEFAIRAAQTEDISKINSLLSSSPSVIIPHADSVYWSFINFYPSMNVIAQSNGEIIGWCGGIKPDNKTGFIWQIFVREDQRRKSIARQMLEKVFSDNYAAGVEKILFAIARDNEPSLQLFKKLTLSFEKDFRRTQENQFLLQTYNEDLYEAA